MKNEIDFDALLVESGKESSDALIQRIPSLKSQRNLMTNTILKIEAEEDVVPILISNVKVTIENGKDNCSSGSDD